MAKKTPLPSASDYPPLEKWLTEHNAREAWRAVAPQGAAVACYVVGTSTALALLRPDGRGWEIYTSLDTTDIPASLADAHDRVIGGASTALGGVLARYSERSAEVARLGRERDEARARVADLERALADARGHARKMTDEDRAAAERALVIEGSHPGMLSQDDGAPSDPEPKEPGTVIRGWR